MVDGSYVCTKVVRGRDRTGCSAFVGRVGTVGNVPVKERIVFDSDLQLFGSIVSEHVHQVHVRLVSKNVVYLYAKVFTLVDLHVLEDRYGYFRGQGSTCACVVVDGD